ncbi:hypothetical protein HK097_005720, partial [Rhizophlyctis rosea]
VREIAAGDHHSLLLSSAGKVYSFGRTDSGQLGLPNNSLPDSIKLATPIPSLSSFNVTQISAGSAFSFAVTDEEKDNLFGWGFNECGQLTGEEDVVEEPRRFALNGRKVYMVAGGGQHTVLLLRRKGE